jgi:hypothetical protein
MSKHQSQEQLNQHAETFNRINELNREAGYLTLEQLGELTTATRALSLGGRSLLNPFKQFGQR